MSIMKGGFVHNNVIVNTCAAALRLQGARVRLEHPVQRGRTGGSVDLFAEVGELRVVVEAERSSERIANDLRKAAQLEADLLLIVTPAWPLARAITRKLTRHPHDADRRLPRTLCLPLGPAVQRLASICALMTARNVLRTTNQKINPPSERTRPEDSR